MSGTLDDIGNHVPPMGHPNEPEVTQISHHAVSANGPVQAGTQLISRRTVVGIDEDEFRHGVHEGHRIANVPKSQHVLCIRCTSLARGGLSSLSGLKALLTQGGNELSGVDEHKAATGARSCTI